MKATSMMSIVRATNMVITDMSAMVILTLKVRKVMGMATRVSTGMSMGKESIAINTSIRNLAKRNNSTYSWFRNEIRDSAS